MYDDLQKVGVRIYPSLASNFSLIDSAKLSETFTEEALQDLKKQGVKYKALPPPQMGGGFGFPSTLLEMFNWAIENKELITFFLSIHAKLILHLRNASLENRLRSRPQFIIYLQVSTREKVDNLYSLQEMIHGILQNLLIIANNLQTTMNDCHKFFGFGVSIDVKVEKISYKYNIYFNDEHLGPFTQLRASKIVKFIPVAEKTSISYRFNKIGLVARTDCKYSSNGIGGGIIEHYKTYYMLGSSRVLKDYIWKFRNTRAFAKQLISTGITKG